MKELALDLKDLYTRSLKFVLVPVLLIYILWSVYHSHIVQYNPSLDNYNSVSRDSGLKK